MTLQCVSQQMSSDKQLTYTRGSGLKLFHWCCGRNVSLYIVNIQIAQFYLCLRKELRMTVPAIKGYRSAMKPCDGSEEPNSSTM